METKRTYIAEVVGLLQSEGGGTRFFFTAFSKEYSKTDAFRVYCNSKEWIQALNSLTLYSRVKVTKVDEGDFYLDRLMPSKYIHSDYHIYGALERFRKCYLAVEQDRSFTGMNHTAIAIISSAILLASQQALLDEMKGE